MASSVPDASFLEELSDNFLQCPVHLDRFEKPKMLPCLHSVCLSCLDLWQKQMHATDQVTCPQCRKVCPVPPDGVQSFPDNFLINSLLDYVDQQGGESGDKKCEICETDSPISEVVRCVDCSMFLCSGCTASHKKIPSTADHQLIPMAEFDGLSVAEKLNLASPLCPKHPTSRLEFFCTKCKTPVCTQCTVVAHKAPVHKIQELTEAYTKLKKQLESELKGFQKKSSKIQQHIAATTANITELETQRDLAYETAQQQAEKIIELVSQFQTEIEEQIDEEFTEQKAALDEHLEDLLQIDEDFKHTQEFGDRIIQFGNHVTLTSVGPDIIRKISDLRSAFQKRSSSQAKADLHLQINNEFESELCSDSIGFIKRKEADSEELSNPEGDSLPSTPIKTDHIEFPTGVACAENTIIMRTYKGRSYPGRILNLPILVRDAHGNPAKIDVATDWSCKMKMPQVTAETRAEFEKFGRSASTSSIREHQDGTILISFLPGVPGHFTLFVTMNGKPIKSYPYQVQVFPGGKSEDITTGMGEVTSGLENLSIDFGDASSGSGGSSGRERAREQRERRGGRGGGRGSGRGGRGGGRGGSGGERGGSAGGRGGSGAGRGGSVGRRGGSGGGRGGSRGGKSGSGVESDWSAGGYTEQKQKGHGGKKMK